MVKINIEPPPSKWGAVSLTDAVTTVLPPGIYAATVSEATVVENDTSQFIRMAFEVVTSDGEAVEPDMLWLTVATIAPERKASLRQGLVMLSKLATALAPQGITLDGKTADEIATAVIASRVRVVLSAQGVGVERKNTVRNVLPVET